MSNNNLGIFERNDPYINLAINQIFDTFGDSVQIKPKSLLKFGRNPDVDSSVVETVWFREGNETFATGNDIDTISSSNAGDTEEIVIEGHTLSGSNLTFVSQSVTLTGQTKATLGTPLYRITRAYNNGSTDLVGNIYVYEDTAITSGVPSDTTKVHLKMDGPKNQSEKASTSFSSVDYGIITSVYGGISSRGTNGAAQFNLQIREFGKVFRTVLNFASERGETRIELEPYIIVPPNSDVRITAQGSVNNLEVVGGFNAFFGLIDS